MLGDESVAGRSEHFCTTLNKFSRAAGHLTIRKRGSWGGGEEYRYHCLFQSHPGKGPGGLGDSARAAFLPGGQGGEMLREDGLRGYTNQGIVLEGEMEFP